MSDVIEFLKTRRSVKPREMNGAGPTQAELETILTIGARVPDHGKIAPWRFILFEGDARKKAGEIIAQVFIKKNPDASEQDIAKALEGSYKAEHLFALRQAYELWQFYQKKIAECDQAIEAVLQVVVGPPDPSTPSDLVAQYRSQKVHRFLRPR